MNDGAIALTALSSSDAMTVGRKAARLGHLIHAGFTVPDGVVLPLALLRDDRLEPDDATSLGERIRSELAEVARRFSGRTVAVRSSAPNEDGDVMSLAGAYDSKLNVTDLDGLTAAVRACLRPSVALIIQDQVDADVSGVAFSANPLTGERRETVVEAASGTAGVTGRSGATERWTVRDGLARIDGRSAGLLDADGACAVAAMACRAEAAFGAPQDIEWARADDTLFILQSRPITALPRPPHVTVPPGSWVKESGRYPEPMTRLGASVAVELVGEGLTAMFTEFGAMVRKARCLSIGGEIYQRLTPVAVGGSSSEPTAAAPPWWLLGLAARAAPTLRRRLRRTARRANRAALARDAREWLRHGREDLRTRIADYAAVDLAASSNAGAAEHLRELFDWVADCMIRHFRLIPAEVVPLYVFTSLCREQLGWNDTRALELMAGSSVTTSAPARALAPIAARVRTLPDAVAALETGADPVAVLAAADPGLAAEFDSWRGLYGLACVSDDPGSPTLGEQPGLLSQLLLHTEDAGGADPRHALAEARRQLRTRPARVARRFEAARRDAIDTYWIREDAAFWTSALPCGLLRLACIDAGRRLAAENLIDRADDIIHIGIEQAIRSLSGDAGDLRPIVRSSRAERAWTRAHPGPPVLGPDPAPPPDMKALPRTARIPNEALLWSSRSSQSAANRTVDVADRNAAVTGRPGCPGVHTGPVRIVRSAADLMNLRRGDVLVCPTTDPAWAVVFDSVGGLVTDRGGTLSHAAIVAREFGIPAVVDTANATSYLTDGEIVTVDGNAGVVRTAAQPEPAAHRATR